MEWWEDEEYDQACPTCGALIEHEKKKLHNDWHVHLEDLLTTIGQEARRYKSPPTYGG